MIYLADGRQNKNERITRGELDNTKYSKHFFHSYS